jgi:hypothetical protein
VSDFEDEEMNRQDARFAKRKRREGGRGNSKSEIRDL